MKKSLLTLGAATLALTSMASTRILYSQNYETVESKEATGWSFNGASWDIASDDFGKFMELSLGQNNGRSGQLTWGQDIFMKDGESVLEDGTYHLEFDFSIAKGSNNQYNGCFTIFTNHAPVANQPYRDPWSPAGYWQNYLFDMRQDGVSSLAFAINGGTIETIGEDGTTTYAIDLSDPKSFTEGMWYKASMDVNVNDRTVEYQVAGLDGEEVQSGTLEVPENNVNGDPISMYAEGLYVMLARYQTIYQIDNILISYESEADVANAPVVALTRLGKTAEEELDLNLRAYTITFLDGEVLHVTGTNGQTIETEFADCDGAYVYETTTSGVLKVWTTCGTATSEVVEVEVDCAPCALPDAVATISAVEAGYGKTYTLTVDNANVPLRPTIFIDYEFVGKNGEKVSATGEASGVKVTVPGEGTLKITTSAWGYQATTVSIDNDVEFEVKQQWDFARMSDEDIKAVGFPEYKILNSSATSGFNNWTARKRLYYNLEGSEVTDDEGKVSWTTVYPFGFVAEDSENVMYYTEIDTEGEVATNVAGYELFPGLNVFAGHNVSYIKHIGVYNNATSGGNNKNIDVLNCDAADFVVINRINNYGGNSNHPVCATTDEYYAQLEGENEVYKGADGTLNEETGLYTVSLPVYRIDTAATCVTVYKQAGAESAVEGVEAVKAVDNNWYSIDGVRVAEPTRAGLYIHNGKKVIVK